jgi:tetratricopeptide (TPR) repeat protein
VVALVLVTALATLVYSNTFSAAFHFDDIPNIVKSSRIRHLTALGDDVVQRVAGSREIGFVTFALNYRFGGLSVTGYHVVNLGIHITNGWLVYVLVMLLFRTPAMRSGPTMQSPGPIRLVALTTALVFVAHPIQTQAVTYIVQRFTSLATCFYLLTAVCYLRWRLTEPRRPFRYGWYLLALGSTVLAMTTKEISVTLPIMLLVVEGLCFRSVSARRWLPLVPFLMTLPIIPLALSGSLLEDQAGVARETTEISRMDYLATQFRVILTYIRLLILPIQQNVDYDYPIYDSLSATPVLVSLLVLAGLAGVTVYLLFKPAPWRVAAFGLVWFFLTLSVESSVIPIRDVIFEHRLYLPSIGFLLAASVVTLARFDRPPAAAIVMVGVVVSLFAVSTYQRNQVWRDEITLWTDTVAKSPHKARPHNNLGLAYTEEGRLPEAIAEFSTAVRLDPAYPDPRVNLAVVYNKQGRLAEATTELVTAVRISPNFPEAHNNLGLAYLKQGRFADAAAEFATVIRLRPDDAVARNNLGNVYGQQGRLQEAISEYRTALALRPDYAEAVNNLGVAYAQQGRLEQAIEEFEHALELKPDYAEARNNLGNAYANQGKLREAMEQYQAASRLTPDYPEARNNLGNAYLQQGRLEEAAQEFVAALRLMPNLPEAHNNLGNVLIRQGELDRAIDELTAALELREDYAEAHLTLGIAYSRQGRLDEAINHYVRALEIDPSLFKAHYNLGKAYQQRGAVDKARRHFELALKLAPDFAPAAKALQTLPAANSTSRSRAN